MKDKFCPLPFMHIGIEPSGKAKCCCHISEELDIGNFKDGSLESILNNPNLIDLRNSFLKGEQPDVCKICWDEESAGIKSMRELTIQQMELEEIEKVKKEPVIKELELRLSNQCNMACLTCDEFYSSRIAREKGIKEVLRPYNQEGQFLSSFEELLPNLEVLYFGGGEPTQSDLHLKVLDLVIEKRPDLKVVYNTNLSLPNEGILIKKWGQLGDLHIGVSLDGIERLGELIRPGLKWKKIWTSLTNLTTFLPRVKFSIHLTVSTLNIFHLPKALNYLLNQTVSKSLPIKLNIVHSPLHYNVRALPKNLKDKANNILKLEMKHLLLKGEDKLVAQLSSLVRFMQEEDFSKKELYTLLNSFDNLDDEILRYLPELKEILADLSSE